VHFGYLKFLSVDQVILFQMNLVGKVFSWAQIHFIDAYCSLVLVQNVNVPLLEFICNISIGFLFNFVLGKLFF